MGWPRNDPCLTEHPNKSWISTTFDASLMATVWMNPQTCLKAEGNQWDTGVSGRVKPSPRCRKAIVVLAETSPGGFEA